MRQEVLLGNGAIARGLVEAGVHFVSSYPGTPSSEILPHVLRFARQEELDIYIEWSVNEKVAYDLALAASYTGKRAAVVMKQVGLNVAADSLFSSVYTGVKGGLVVISTDDPGPFSSQTEQDTRFWGLFAKVPVLDPSTPEEAKAMMAKAFEISEAYEIPVIVRPVLRVCHARATIGLEEPTVLDRPAAFEKNPQRWAATPRFRHQLHKDLNRKLGEMEQAFSQVGDLNFIVDGDAPSEGAIVAGGIHYAILRDLLEEHGVTLPVLKIGASHPFPRALVERFVSGYEKILVLESTHEVLELQLRAPGRVFGRLDGTVPREGEPTPDNTLAALRTVFPEAFGEHDPTLDTLQEALGGVDLPVRRPTLCPGCPHRAAFYAIRRAFPKGIYTSDIGCYTLGTNLGAVDTVLDMGASVGMAVGFYHAHRLDGADIPIVATIGDSTFYHAGIPPLVDAVYTDARFILVILDNAITAMTGMQPTPGTGLLIDGSQGRAVPMEDVVRGTGVTFLKVLDPYDLTAMRNVLKEARAHTQAEDGGVAVIVARHPCILHYRDATPAKGTVVITDRCVGCFHCVTRFECPALSKDEGAKRAVLDEKLCIGCGVCVDVCPKQAMEVVTG